MTSDRSPEKLSLPPHGDRTPGARAEYPARLAVIILAALAIQFTLHLTREVMIPVVIGILMTYLLEPMVAWLARRHVPRAIGSILVLLLTLAPVSAGCYALSGQVDEIADQLPIAARRVARQIEGLRRSGFGALGKVQETAAVLEKSASRAVAATAPGPGVTRVEVQPPAFSASRFLWSGSVSLATVAGYVLMTLFLSYFMLASGDLYRRKLARIAGRAGQGELTARILDDVNARIGRYLLALLVSNVAVSVLTSAAFALLGLNHAVSWGILAGALNTIPYFGPVLVTIVVGVVAAVQFGSIGEIGAVCGAALAITALEGWALTPILMGRAAKMNAVAVFVSLLAWTWIWGVWGTLLAVPMMTVLKAVCDHVDGLDWIGELLGE